MSTIVLQYTLAACLCIALAACGGSVLPPPQPQSQHSLVVDRAASACVVSADGFAWYTIPGGSFSPIIATDTKCGTELSTTPSPPIPTWAQASGGTQALFVATSFQQAYSVAGMESIETAAAAQHVPVTWMIDSPTYFAQFPLYQAYHSDNGDDVEVGSDPSMVQSVQAALPWYVPTISAEGAGYERNISEVLALGEIGFWGISWNSHGVDGTFDEGAPWGTYCADPSSYKRPAPDGSCSLVAFEWTARDLDRAYLGGHEEYYSTDPDDLQERAGFSVSGAQTYVRDLVNAYAAAGKATPLVMVSQQESAEDVNPGDPQILNAMYAQAVADGMHVETLAQAGPQARSFSAAPRAVAFPFISGGLASPSILDGGTVYPAVIDYRDSQAMLTFVAGQTMPTRAFEYVDDPTSTYDIPDVVLPSAETPKLEAFVVSGGAISIQISAPRAVHYGIALWTDPTTLGLSGSNVVPAGRAGVVLTFDLRVGENQLSFPCAQCTNATFTYST